MDKENKQNSGDKKNFKLNRFHFLGIIILVIFAVSVYFYKDFNKKIEALTSAIIKQSQENVEENNTENKELPIENNIQENSDSENIENIVESNENIQAQSEKSNNVILSQNLVNCVEYSELISILINLRDKIYKSENFQKEIFLLTVSKSIDQNMLGVLKKIEPYAEQGVLDIAALKEEFKSIENDIIKVSWFDSKTNSWKRFLLKILSNFVFVKKTGQRAMDEGGVDMIVQNVNDYLDSEELLLAIEEVSKLNGNLQIKELTDLWVLQVQNHIDVYNLIEDLTKYVLSNKSCKCVGNKQK